MKLKLNGEKVKDGGAKTRGCGGEGTVLGDDDCPVFTFAEAVEAVPPVKTPDGPRRAFRSGKLLPGAGLMRSSTYSCIYLEPVLLLLSWD